MIAKDTELQAYVIRATQSCSPSADLKTRVMWLLHGDPVCVNGQERTRGEIDSGWIACGRAGVCACARAAVSEKVKQAKQQATTEQKRQSREKAKNTLQQRYGVTNAGQTARARENHQKFYADPQKVEQQVHKQQQTLTEKYGVANPQHIASTRSKTIQTCETRWGVSNPMQNPIVAQQSSATRKLNWDPKKVLQQNFAQFFQQAQDRWGVTPLITAEQYTGVAARPEICFRCNQCGYEFTKRFDYAVPPVCKICNPAQTSYLSKEEQSVADWIRQHYTGSILQGDRSIINPWQLDIVLPDIKLAVEYCGLYWHSELSSGKHWKYHAEKTRLCEQAGYRLITMFSDEWLQRTTQTQSKLLNIIGVQTGRIHARSCEVKEISYEQARDFHNQYHIQGSPKKLGVNLALLFQGVTVAVSSWVKQLTNQWELVRLSSSARVSGGAGRLLKHFCRIHNPQTIVSFSDNRWSQGGMYAQLGFTMQSTVPPMQHYVQNYQTRYHKLAFSKHKIVQQGEPTALRNSSANKSG